MCTIRERHSWVEKYERCPALAFSLIISPELSQWNRTELLVGRTGHVWIENMKNMCLSWDEIEGMNAPCVAVKGAIFIKENVTYDECALWFAINVATPVASPSKTRPFLDCCILNTTT